MKYLPHSYQTHAEDHVVKHRGAGLMLDMGLGKTVIILTAIKRLMYQILEVSRVLVIAPKRVAENVWPAEQQKWDHLRLLKLSIVSGSQQERAEALKKPADVYVIGRDNVAWLVKHYQSRLPFDMLVVDESSSFKNPRSIRFRSLRMVLPQLKRRVILTGTPAPNGLIDLWSQIYLIDQGKRLGNTISGYRERYFQPERRNQFQVFSYRPRDGATEVIHRLISDACVSMSAKDYLELPELLIINTSVRLSSKVQKLYDDFERDQMMQVLGQEITAVSAAALVTKLLQCANGAVYNEEMKAVVLHEEKLEALDEILEQAEVEGENVLVFYSFVHDRDRIMARHPQARTLKTEEDIRDWCDRKVKLMLAHPQSAGHGLNLQDGGHTMVWFGPTYNLELWLQAIARLHRQGQEQAVRVYVLVAEETIDQDVVRRIDRKRETQDLLIEAVKFRLDKYRQLVR